MSVFFGDSEGVENIESFFVEEFTEEPDTSCYSDGYNDNYYEILDRVLRDPLRYRKCVQPVPLDEPANRAPSSARVEVSKIAITRSGMSAESIAAAMKGDVCDMGAMCELIRFFRLERSRPVERYHGDYLVVTRNADRALVAATEAGENNLLCADGVLFRYTELSAAVATVDGNYVGHVFFESARKNTYDVAMFWGITKTRNEEYRGVALSDELVPFIRNEAYANGYSFIATAPLKHMAKVLSLKGFDRLHLKADATRAERRKIGEKNLLCLVMRANVFVWAG